MTTEGDPRDPRELYDLRTPSGPHWSAPRPEPPEPSEPPASAHEPVAPLAPGMLPGRAPRHSAHMSGYLSTSTRSTRQRFTWLVTVSIGVIGISALIAACFSWTLLPSLQAFVGSQLSAAPGQAPSGPPRGQYASTPLPPTDWRSEILVGANYRFRIDMPSMLACSHGFFINDFSGFGCDYFYAGAPTQTALQHVERETQVELLSSTKITDRNICPQGGTSVRVGTGADTFTGWERDAVSSTTSDGTVTLNLVVHGTPIQLSLMGFGGEQQPFFERYGVIWRHMLASFTLLPAPVTQTVHPCG